MLNLGANLLKIIIFAVVFDKKSILNFLKKISVKRAIRKNLKKRMLNDVFSLKKTEKILCLVHSDEIQNFDFIKDMVKVFSIKSENFVVVECANGKQKTDNFSEEKISIFGSVTDEKINQILSEKYDVLLNCFTKNDLPILLLSSKVKAKLKIGFSGIDEEYNDLIINCKVNQMEVFVKEIEKVIKVIK